MTDPKQGPLAGLHQDQRQKEFTLTDLYSIYAPDQKNTSCQDCNKIQNKSQGIFFKSHHHDITSYRQTDTHTHTELYCRLCTHMLSHTHTHKPPVHHRAYI